MTATAKVDQANGSTALATAQAGTSPAALGLVYPCDALALDAAQRMAHSGMARPVLIGPAALIVAAALMYIPANLLPIMQINSIAGNSAHTILGGVIELVGMGSYSIAAVVFIASVVVPLFKLVCLTILVYLAQKRAAGALRTRTHLYEVVEFIGQWSMLDVFVVILLSALGRFGALLTIDPGGGAAAFAGVVILTMLAALGFDPRLAWRRAGHRRHLRPEFAKMAS